MPICMKKKRGPEKKRQQIFLDVAEYDITMLYNSFHASGKKRKRKIQYC